MEIASGIVAAVFHAFVVDGDSQASLVPIVGLAMIGALGAAGVKPSDCRGADLNAQVGKDLGSGHTHACILLRRSASVSTDLAAVTAGASSQRFWFSHVAGLHQST